MANLNVLANDVDADNNLLKSTWELITAPEHGLVSYNVTTAIVVYTPQPTYVGADAFSYRVRDDRGAMSLPVIVTLTVANSQHSAYQNPTNIFDVNENGGVSPFWMC